MVFITTLVLNLALFLAISTADILQNIDHFSAQVFVPISSKELKLFVL